MQAANLLQYAVDAVANAQKGIFRLEVDIGGTALDRIHQQRADQAHHRLGVFLVARLQALVVDLAGFDLAQDAIHREFETVELVDVFFQLRLAREHGANLDLAAQMGAQQVQRHHVEHIAHRHQQVLCVPG